MDSNACTKTWCNFGAIRGMLGYISNQHLPSMPVLHVHMGPCTTVMKWQLISTPFCADVAAAAPGTAAALCMQPLSMLPLWLLLLVLLLLSVCQALMRHASIKNLGDRYARHHAVRRKAARPTAEQGPELAGCCSTSSIHATRAGCKHCCGAAGAQLTLSYRSTSPTTTALGAIQTPTAE